jgi:hypothetical protein
MTKQNGISEGISGVAERGLIDCKDVLGPDGATRHDRGASVSGLLQRSGPRAAVD